jgi:macrolide transport system ATP-binding/permease protein
MHVVSVPSAGASAHIALSEVSVSRGSLRLLTDVDLAISVTSRVALVGENGRGKTTLLHVLAGVVRLRSRSSSLRASSPSVMRCAKQLPSR